METYKVIKKGEEFDRLDAIAAGASAVLIPVNKPLSLSSRNEPSSPVPDFRVERYARVETAGHGHVWISDQGAWALSLCIGMTGGMVPDLVMEVDESFIVSDQRLQKEGDFWVFMYKRKKGK